LILPIEDGDVGVDVFVVEPPELQSGGGGTCTPSSKDEEGTPIGDTEEIIIDSGRFSIDC